MKPILLIQNCETESPGTIVDYLQQKSRPFTLVHSYRGEKLPAIENVEAVISMGTPISAIQYHRHDHLVRVHDLIKDAIRTNTPYLGVCFGGQILARAHGALVRRNPVMEIGMYTVRLTGAGRRDPIFDGFDDEFRVFQWHGDTFDIPDHGVHLAESTDCLNQAFRCGKTVGLQFHLEIKPEELTEWCRLYEAELAGMDTTAEKVLAAVTEAVPILREQNDRLLDNFFAGCK